MSNSHYSNYLPSFFFSLPLGMMLVVMAARIGSSVDVESFGGDLSFLGFFASLPPCMPFAMMFLLVNHEYFDSKQI
jgi:hypothetical protein